MPWFKFVVRMQNKSFAILITFAFFVSILSLHCGNLYTDSLDSLKSIPLPAFIKPYYATGVLDVSFGNYGVASGSIPGDQDAESVGMSAVVDKFGRIYVTGQIVKDTVSDMALWRFNTDGSPDRTFGANGCIRTINPLMEEGSNGFIAGFSIAVDVDENVYIASACSDVNDVSSVVALLVWKYNSNSVNNDTLGMFAQFDPQENTGSFSIFPYDIKIDYKGRIIVVGHLDRNIVILRYNKNGLLDPSFGGDGFVVGPGFTDYPYIGITSMMKSSLDENGRILVTGPLISESSQNSLDVIKTYRFNEDGTPDNNYGQGGVVIQDGVARNNEAGGQDVGFSVLNDSLGRVYVLGYSVNTNDIGEMVLLCYNENGILDPRFGNNGIVVGDDIPYEPFYGEYATTMTLDPKGKLIVGGLYSGGMSIWRYNPEGTPDLDFGHNGYVTYNFDVTNSMNLVQSILMDNIGRIIVLGGMGNNKHQMTLWRFK